MKPKTCLGPDCNNPLTGKQRLYCSPACGKRYRRQMGPNGPEWGPNGERMGQNVPEWVQFVGPNREKWDSLGNRHTWRVYFDVEIRTDKAEGEWDLGRLNKAIRSQISQILSEYLAWKWPKLTIRIVRVEGNYTGDFKWPD